jgi:aldose 1-epimerase
MHNYFTWAVVVVAIASAACLIGCAPALSKVQISKESFGAAPDGTPVDIYTLRNAKGFEAKITNYGGVVVSLKAPDRQGTLADVVLGFDNLSDYIKGCPYFGALIGRYGNRIAKGKFDLNGKTYTLATNDGPNHLHGGVKGFDKVVWKGQSSYRNDGREPSLLLKYVSKDGEEGYPGTLTVNASYTLTEDNALRLDFDATTDSDTIVNLTHHSYFNLAGQGDVLGHEVMIQSNQFTPVDNTLIPTGELRSVQGTPFDFNAPTAIGARINQEDEQLKFCKGYDHNWVVNKSAGELGLMARVYEPSSGRVLEVLSNEPGLQFYTGNFLDGKLQGKNGKFYQFRSGFCMEPQHYPDSPNKPNFPSVVLKPGETYKHTIIYRFSVRK